MKPKEEVLNHSELSNDPDDLSDNSSSSDDFDDQDLLNSACQDEITAQLAAAGKCRLVSCASLRKCLWNQDAISKLHPILIFP